MTGINFEIFKKTFTNRWNLDFTCGGCNNRSSCERNNTFCLRYLEEHLENTLNNKTIRN